jgi:hypothetical protein
VNFRDGNETTAYYTDDLEDAVNTGLRWPISERFKRSAVQGWNGDMASPERKLIIEQVALPNARALAALGLSSFKLSERENPAKAVCELGARV